MTAWIVGAIVAVVLGYVVYRMRQLKSKHGGYVIRLDGFYSVTIDPRGMPDRGTVEIYCSRLRRVWNDVCDMFEREYVTGRMPRPVISKITIQAESIGGKRALLYLGSRRLTLQYDALNPRAFAAELHNVWRHERGWPVYCVDETDSVRAAVCRRISHALPQVFP